MVPWQAAATGTQAEAVHPARDRADRDRVLVRVADIVVAVDSDWGVRTRLVSEARAAEREAVYAGSRSSAGTLDIRRRTGDRPGQAPAALHRTEEAREAWLDALPILDRTSTPGPLSCETGSPWSGERPPRHCLSLSQIGQRPARQLLTGLRKQVSNKPAINRFWRHVMSTPAPAPGRRFRTMIRRKLAITAGAVLAGGALAAAPAQASALPDTVQLLGVAPNGTDSPTLSHNIHNADSSYQGWAATEGNGGSQYFDVGTLDGLVGLDSASIAGLPDGSTQSVAVGTDYNLYFNIRDANGAWQGWSAVEGAGGAKYFYDVDGSGPSITGMPDGSSQLIATGDDGSLYFNIRYANGTWQGWAEVEGYGGAPNFEGYQPSITGMPDGSSQIVEQGDDGSLYHNIHYANGTWQGWRLVGGLDGSSYLTGTAVIASLPDGSSQVFTTTAGSNATWENTRASNGNWSGWTDLNGNVQTVAAAGFGAVG
jgi:hypothetical protein